MATWCGRIPAGDLALFWHILCQRFVQKWQGTVAEESRGSLEVSSLELPLKESVGLIQFRGYLRTRHLIQATGNTFGTIFWGGNCVIWIRNCSSWEKGETQENFKRKQMRQNSPLNDFLLLKDSYSTLIFLAGCGEITHKLVDGWLGTMEPIESSSCRE